MPHSRRSFIALSQAALAPMLFQNGTDGEPQIPRTAQLITADTIQDLRELGEVKKVSPVLALILGRAEPHDGDGGLFFYDPKATGADDGRTFIAVSDTKKGRWRRLGDSSNIDNAGLAEARDSCWANNLTTLEIPDGEYIIGSKLDLAKDHWACVALGGNAKIKHVGAGIAVSLSGPSDNPNYGTYRGILGGDRPIVIEGNTKSTRLLDVDNFHHGLINVDLKNGGTGVHIADSIQNVSSAGAVLTKFKVRVSQGNDGPFTTTPAHGFYASKIFGCQCDLLIEHCGGKGNFGVHLEASAANLFYGASEGNESGGVFIAADSYRNTFVGFFCEENGAGADFDIRGDFNRLLNCTGVSSRGSLISGDYTVVEGGKFNNLRIGSDANYTVLDSVDLIGSFMDNSATTTVRNCRLNGEPMHDYAPHQKALLTLGRSVASYAESDPSYQAPICYRSIDGSCQVAGSFAMTASISTGETIAIIPVGYRPAARIMFTAVNVSTNLPICLTADSAGNLQTRSPIGKGNVVGLLSPPFIGG